jgi:hypothetical protein
VLGRLRPSPRAAVLEVLLLSAVVVVFSWLHTRVGRDIASATHHARGFHTLERSLHLDLELPVNAWLAGHHAVTVAAVAFYRLYYLPLLAVLVWLFVRHPDNYRRVRRVLVAMTVTALLVFWALPVAPPRFALAGIIDIVARYDIMSARHTLDRTSGANYTAFPSLHVGWSAWCAYAVWSVCRRAHPRAALLAWLFPLLMTAVVWATGNHYVLDVVGSAGLLLVGLALANGWTRVAELRNSTGR